MLESRLLVGAGVAAAIIVLGDDVAVAVEQPDPAVMDIRIGNSVDVDRDDRAGRQIDLVVSALAVSGGVDGRMEDRRRIEDVRVAGQGEVVRRCRTRSRSSCSSRPVPAWRSRFPCPGVAARRPGRRNRRAGCRRRGRRRSCRSPPWPVNTLAAPLPVSRSSSSGTCEVLDGDIDISAGSACQRA